MQVQGLLTIENANPLITSVFLLRALQPRDAPPPTDGDHTAPNNVGRCPLATDDV
jgi:hypothetical protein